MRTRDNRVRVEQIVDTHAKGREVEQCADQEVHGERSRQALELIRLPGGREIDTAEQGAELI